jgi:hypothetical protein
MKTFMVEISGTLKARVVYDIQARSEEEAKKSAREPAKDEKCWNWDVDDTVTIRDAVIKSWEYYEMPDSDY